MQKKIVFLGTPNFAVPVLKELKKSEYDLVCVLTQPPRKAHRGQKLNKSPVQLVAEDLNISVKIPEKIEKEKDYLKSLNFDIAVVVAYGQIIPKSIINLSNYGFINIHASLLPKWRGAAPIQRSILNLETQTGISFMRLNEKLDEGPVCNTYKVEIKENENSENLSRRLSELGASKIIENLKLIFENKANFKEQNHQEATYAKKIHKLEGKINWKDSSKKILSIINGLFPNPGGWFTFKNERYKILKALSSDKIGQPGRVMDNQLEIACGSGSIKVIEIQRQGKKAQNIKDFISGSQIKINSVLDDA